MPGISLKDIASKAGVSVGTVDRVIHNRGNVSAKFRKRVMEVLEENEYIPNLMARGLATKKSYRIAALLPHSSHDPFWGLPLDGIRKAENHVKNFGFQIDIFHYKDGVENDLLNVGMKIFNKNYNAILIAPIMRDEATVIFAECEKRQIPYIQINTFISRQSKMFLSFVGQDSYGSGKLAAKLFDFGTNDGETLLILHLEREVYNSEHLIQKELGFRDYFKSNPKKKIEIDQLTFSDLDSNTKRKTFVKYALKQNPKLSGVFVTTSKLHCVIDDFMKLSDKKLNFIGFDLIEDNLNHLDNENVLFLINQNPIEQGYRGIMSLFNFIVHKADIKKTQHLPLDVVMKENVAFYTNDQNQMMNRD